MIKDIMGAAEVATHLCISVTAVHRLAQRGTLPSEWAGACRIWRGSTIRRYEQDAEAQARRRKSDRQPLLDLDEELERGGNFRAALEAQAPIGRDPKGRGRSHAR